MLYEYKNWKKTTKINNAISDLKSVEWNVLISRYSGVQNNKNNYQYYYDWTETSETTETNKNLNKR